jgi:class 3 adenylate cyclase
LYTVAAQDFGSKAFIENTVTCAKKIIARCNNYKIDLSYTDSEISAKVFIETEPSTSPPKALSPRGKRASYSSTQHSMLLNVHCAISEGLMAGIDVGYMDRWEYFIFGRPLDEAARALNESQLGELVLSSSAHHIYHEQLLQEGWDIDGVRGDKPCSLSCGCRYTPSKSFNVNVSVLKAKESGMSDYDFNAPGPIRQYELIIDDVFNYLEAIKESLLVNNPILDGLQNDEFLSHGVNCIERRLLNHLMRHLHFICRDNFVFREESIPVVSIESKINPPCKNSSNISSEKNSLDSDIGNNRESFVQRIRGLSFELFSAEIRTVVSMFIKLNVEATLLESSSTISAQSPTTDCFNFLNTSEAERQADDRILETLQNCMVIISETILDRGGQLRQFMVDDKGTISIGIFGLRSSELTTKERSSLGDVSSNDVAANDAIEAGLQIISRLREIQVDASVGIAMGKVYCGLIGSVGRCEYTVMGPSVNMSARLMTEAKIGEVLCDENTYLSASKHTFESLSTIPIKGYDNPVPVYKPRTFMINSLSSFSEIAWEDWPSRSSKTILHGKCNCFKEIVELFFPPIPESGIVLSDFSRDVSNIEQLTLEYAQKQVARQGFVSELLSAPCKVAVVVGPHGVGKSTILKYSQDIFNEMSSLTKLTIYSTRCTSCQINGPFSCWGNIFRNIITKLTQSYDSSECPEDSAEDDFSKIILMLPNEFRHQKYLLKIPLFKFYDSEIIDEKSEKMVGSQKIGAQIHLYAAVFELYIRKFMSPLVLIV